jgi:excisionase family DNA binding protein
MGFLMLIGDKAMSKMLELQELGCKSTRETAKILQVSLGTIQKMVETGELVAWKTRGGHRRILIHSIERQLEKRLNLLKHFSSKHFNILGIFKDQEDIQQFENHCLQFESSVQNISLIDLNEALMRAVQIKPDIIYLDKKISQINQYFIMHHLNNNTVTNEIPLLMHQEIAREDNPILEAELGSITYQAASPKTRKNTYLYSDSFETIEHLIKTALFNRVM